MIRLVFSTADSGGMCCEHVLGLTSIHSSFTGDEPQFPFQAPLSSKKGDSHCTLP